ncbi:hypothetical protein J3F83DRAFT_687094 [Trichoderma novae-zelandiae]
MLSVIYFQLSHPRNKSKKKREGGRERNKERKRASYFSSPPISWHVSPLFLLSSSSAPPCPFFLSFFPLFHLPVCLRVSVQAFGDIWRFFETYTSYLISVAVFLPLFLFLLLPFVKSPVPGIGSYGKVVDLASRCSS